MPAPGPWTAHRRRGVLSVPRCGAGMHWVQLAPVLALAGSDCPVQRPFQAQTSAGTAACAQWQCPESRLQQPLAKVPPRLVPALKQACGSRPVPCPVQCAWLPCGHRLPRRLGRSQRHKALSQALPPSAHGDWPHQQVPRVFPAPPSAQKRPSRPVDRTAGQLLVPAARFVRIDWPTCTWLQQGPS